MYCRTPHPPIIPARMIEIECKGSALKIKKCDILSQSYLGVYFFVSFLCFSGNSACVGGFGFHAFGLQFVVVVAHDSVQFAIQFIQRAGYVFFPSGVIVFEVLQCLNSFFE